MSTLTLAAVSKPSRPLPDVDGVEHRFVDAGGVRLHVAEAGDPGATPLVLLHGWPQHWWMWRGLIGPLSERARVICPDLRGFGWSEAPGRGYDPDTFADDVVALLDALGIAEPVALAGHDWGGWTGFMVGLRHPERVRRLLALGILHPFVRPTWRGLLSGWRFWYQWALAAPPGARALRRLAGDERSPVISWIWRPRGAFSDRERRCYMAQFSELERARASSRLYRHALRLQLQIVRGRFRDRILSTPTLLLFGERENIQSPDLLPGFERNAPRMRIELLPGCAHFVVEERPQIVLDRCRTFLLADPDQERARADP